MAKKTDERQRWLNLAFRVAVILAAIGVGFIARWAAVDPKTLEILVEVEAETTPRAQGWVYDPESVQAHMLANMVPSFGDTPAGRAALLADGDTLLWEAPRKVTGDVLPARDQGGVGSCVSFAQASVVEHLICVQIASGQRAEYKDLAQEVIYGGSRVEIGGGRIRGDGSIGAWAAKWVKDYGVVPRGVHGQHDLTKYSESRCRDYGRRGVPDELEAVARESPVKEYAQVRSWQDIERAVSQGYPVNVCSDQGFTMQRDADGFCKPRGTWYHSMAVIGVRGGKRPGGFILNSWGPNAHTGPRYPADAPTAGFWADADVLDRMAQQGDSFAFSDAVGFPSRKLPDWFVLEAKPARNRLDLFALAEFSLAP